MSQSTERLTSNEGCMSPYLVEKGSESITSILVACSSENTKQNLVSLNSVNSFTDKFILSSLHLSVPQWFDGCPWQSTSKAWWSSTFKFSTGPPLCNCRIRRSRLP